MCGIIGAYKGMKPKEVATLVKNGWHKLKHRGKDSYGVIAQLKSGKIWYSKSLKMDNILESLENLNEPINWFIAHNRKASVGSVCLSLAHPIRDGDIFVIHNGTRKLLAKVFNTESDTQAIAKYVLKCPGEVVKQLLKGTGVVFGVHLKRGKIYFHKDYTRTLYICPSKKIFASEPIFDDENWYLIKPTDKWIHSLKELEKFKEPYSNIYYYNYIEYLNYN